MAKYVGAMNVAGGYYWNPRTWEVNVIAEEGGKLPGDASARFVKVPFPLLFVLVPLMGALFLMALPVIGFGLFAYAIVKKVTGGVKKGAEDLAATMTPGWTPGEAHLTGKPGEEKPAGGKESPAIEKLAKELEEKKNAK